MLHETPECPVVLTFRSLYCPNIPAYIRIFISPDILPMAKARGFLFHVTAVVARTLTTTLGDTKPHSDFSSGIEF